MFFPVKKNKGNYSPLVGSLGNLISPADVRMPRFLNGQSWIEMVFFGPHGLILDFLMPGKEKEPVKKGR